MSLVINPSDGTQVAVQSARLSGGSKASSLLAAIAIALLYFLGGKAEAFWTTSPAIFWPPNAILLSALLVSPPRLWWVYVLAVLPADFATSWGLPFGYGCGLYVSNVTQSLLAAWLIRRIWNDEPNWGTDNLFCGSWHSDC